uniref:Uncharacterized protein n=1 Tax=Rangifer tarandus platyrhynchus TaxID=3082113 RepID=A0ACB0EPY5_RANTA|nr:unnamed protein product [Rangifer tarandus platyrhynchus]
MNGLSTYPLLRARDAFVELYGPSMRPPFDFSWLSLKALLSLALVGACITLGAYLGHKKRSPLGREDADLFGTRRPSAGFSAGGRGRQPRLGPPEASSRRRALKRATCTRAAGREDGRPPGPRVGPAPPGARGWAEAPRARVPAEETEAVARDAAAPGKRGPVCAGPRPPACRALCGGSRRWQGRLSGAEETEERGGTGAAPREARACVRRAARLGAVLPPGPARETGRLCCPPSGETTVLPHVGPPPCFSQSHAVAERVSWSQACSLPLGGRLCSDAAARRGPRLSPRAPGPPPLKAPGLDHHGRPPAAQGGAWSGRGRGQGCCCRRGGSPPAPTRAPGWDVGNLTQHDLLPAEPSILGPPLSRASQSTPGPPEEELKSNKAKSSVPEFSLRCCCSAEKSQNSASCRSPQPHLSPSANRFPPPKGLPHKAPWTSHGGASLAVNSVCVRFP